MSNYSNQYFSKDLNELTFEDIEKYFTDSKEESDKIEFKSYHSIYGNFDKNLEGVIRGICAFLNSNGGILIWGAPIGIKSGEKTLYKGSLAPVNKFIDKDSLVSKISDSITPLPINIRIKIIEENNLYIYVFEIEKSSYSPHQYKNTYWARLDGQTKPAPHYLVEALFKKISFPHLEGYIALEKFGNYDNERVYLDLTIYIFNFSELQNEYDVKFSLICPEAIFEGKLNQDVNLNYSWGGHKFENNTQIKTLHFGAPESLSQKLVFNLEEIRDNYNNLMHITLTFGGKNSPLKFSEYVLDFGISSISKFAPKELIKSMVENIFSSDKQKILGTTRENLLSQILKR